MKVLNVDLLQFLNTKAEEGTHYRIAISLNFIRAAMQIRTKVRAENIPLHNITGVMLINAHSINEFLLVRYLLYKNLKKILIKLVDLDQLAARKSYWWKFKIIIGDIAHSSWQCLIYIEGVPICFFRKKISYNGFYHFLRMRRVKQEERNGFQKQHCMRCFFLSYCQFSYTNEHILYSCLSIFEDKPEEIAFEITRFCNLHCSFCFHKNAGKSIKKPAFLERKTVLMALDAIKEYGIRRVRFTGGESLLHPNILDFVRSAKRRGLYVVLNTNALLLTQNTINDFVEYVDNFELPYHHSCRGNGLDYAARRKVESIEYINYAFKRKKLQKKILRLNTVLTEDTYTHLFDMYRIIQKLRVKGWVINRLIPTDRNVYFPTSKEVDYIADIICSLRKKEKQMYIGNGNGLPVCCSHPLKIHRAIAGTYWHDSRNRLFVDCHGFFKPFYYNYRNLGSHMDKDGLERAWNDHFVKQFRYGLSLPDECKDCLFQFKCGGGNRFCAFKNSGSYLAKDVLYNKNNISKYYYF